MCEDGYNGTVKLPVYVYLGVFLLNYCTSLTLNNQNLCLLKHVYGHNNIDGYDGNINLKDQQGITNKIDIHCLHHVFL